MKKRVRFYFSCFSEIEVDTDDFPANNDIISYINHNAYELADEEQLKESLTYQEGEIDVLDEDENI